MCSGIFIESVRCGGMFFKPGSGVVNVTVKLIRNGMTNWLINMEYNGIPLFFLLRRIFTTDRCNIT